MNKNEYEKPVVKIQEANIDANEAYSAAAVPVAAPAVEPALTVGAGVGAAAFSKYCW